MVDGDMFCCRACLGSVLQALTASQPSSSSSSSGYAPDDQCRKGGRGVFSVVFAMQRTGKLLARNSEQNKEQHIWVHRRKFISKRRHMRLHMYTPQWRKNMDSKTPHIWRGNYSSKPSLLGSMLAFGCVEQLEIMGPVDACGGLTETYMVLVLKISYVLIYRPDDCV